MATLAAALTANTPQITISGGTLAVGNLLLIDTEYLNVVNVLTATQAKVKRGVNGTTAAAHTVGTTVTIQTSASTVSAPSEQPLRAAGAAGQVQVNTAGALSGDSGLTYDATGKFLAVVGGVTLGATAFSGLPAAPVAGMVAYVTDATLNTWGSTVAGGGSNKVLAWYNGSVWTIAGK